MTRLERRKKNKRRLIRVLSFVAAALFIVAICAMSVAGAVESEDIPPLVIVDADPEGQEIINPDEDLEITEEPEDFENQKIEEALIVIGYLNEEVPLEYDLQACTMAWSEMYGVPYSISLGVIETESTFRADAVNGSCVGYMQVNENNYRGLNEAIGITDLKDPYQNIHSGVYMLGNLYKKYGDWHKALIGYNAG